MNNDDINVDSLDCDNIKVSKVYPGMEDIDFNDLFKREANGDKALILALKSGLSLHITYDEFGKKFMENLNKQTKQHGNFRVDVTREDKKTGTVVLQDFKTGKDIIETNFFDLTYQI